MEITSRQLGNSELESKEEVMLEGDIGVIQTAKIVKSWEWVWD